MPRYGIPVSNAAQTTDVLTRLLDDRGWSQRDLAERLIVDEKTVSRWMTGSTKLTERRLRKVFATLGVDPTPYGLDPIVATTAQTAGDLDRILEAIGDVHVRVADIPVMRARMELIAQDLAAIREHLGIPTPTGVAS